MLCFHVSGGKEKSSALDLPLNPGLVLKSLFNRTKATAGNEYNRKSLASLSPEEDFGIQARQSAQLPVRMKPPRKETFRGSRVGLGERWGNKDFVYVCYRDMKGWGQSLLRGQ